VAYFAAFKKHIGLYIPTPVIEEHKSELTDYETARATVRFPIDKPLPIALIKKLVKAQVKKNEEGKMPKKAKKKAKKTARKKVGRAKRPKKLRAKAKKTAKKAKRVVKKARKAAPKRVRAPKPPPAPTPPTEPSPVLMEGMRAPDFRLRAYPDGEHSLSDFRGKKVVLYFYPKDDTPGCTMEACAFRDSKSEWEGAGATVLGISNDDWSSHQAFAQKYNLNFTLLADPVASASKSYGVYKEKNMYGKKFWGIERTTFIIDSEGKIAKVFPRVQVDGHSAEVLETLRRI